MNMCMADWSRMVENLKITEPLIPPLSGGGGGAGEATGKRARL